MELNLPKTKEELLNSTASLPYDQRIKAASKLGTKHVQELKPIIKALRQHPEPEVEKETEDGFTEILPAQKSNISKYYNEDRLALAIAASAPKSDVDAQQTFLNELKSPSILFKSIAAKEVARRNITDEEIYNIVMKSVAAFRNDILHACIKYKRVNVLNKAVEYFSNLPEKADDFVARYLHGCSSKVVEKFLLNVNNRVQTSAFLHWDKLCRYHADVVVALLHQSLSTHDGLLTSRVIIWNNWYQLVNTKRAGAGSSARGKRNTVAKDHNNVRDELIRNAKAANKLVVLLEQFPPPNSKFFELPQVFGDNLQYFVTHFRKEIYAFLRNSVWRDENDNIYSHIPQSLWTLDHTQFEDLFELGKVIIALGNATTYFIKPQLDVHFLNINSRRRLVQKATLGELVTFSKVVIEYYNRMWKSIDQLAGDDDYKRNTYRTKVFTDSSNMLRAMITSLNEKEYATHRVVRGRVEKKYRDAKRVKFNEKEKTLTGKALRDLVRKRRTWECTAVAEKKLVYTHDNTKFLKFAVQLVDMWADTVTCMWKKLECADEYNHATFQFLQTLVTSSFHPSQVDQLVTIMRPYFGVYTKVTDRWMQDSTYARSWSVIWADGIKTVATSLVKMKENIRLPEATLAMANKSIDTIVVQYFFPALKKLFPDYHTDVIVSLSESLPELVLNYFWDTFTTYMNANKYLAAAVKPQFQAICKNVKDNNVMTTRVLPYFLQKRKEYLNFILTSLLYKVDNVEVLVNSFLPLFDGIWLDYLPQLGYILGKIGDPKQKLEHFLPIIKKNFEAYSEMLKTIVISIKKQDQALIVQYIVPLFSEDPLANIKMLSWLISQLITEEHKMAVFKLLCTEHILHLAKTTYPVLIDLLRVLPIGQIQDAIRPLFEPGLVSENLLDQLQAFVDINDHQMRSMLQKASNSNSIVERKAAIDKLLSATLRAKNLLQTTRTIKFLQGKLKNETIDNKEPIFDEMFGFNAEEKSSHYSNTFMADGTTKGQFEIWFTMLQDLFDSSDLDERSAPGFEHVLSHRVLKNFITLSWAAMTRALKLVNLEMFQFGFELQWRIALFRLGDKRAAADFRVHLQTTWTMSFNKRLRLADWLIQCYDERISTKNPEWREKIDYFAPLITIVGSSWHQIPLLTNRFAQLLTDATKRLEKDDEGLFVIETDDEVIHYYNQLMALHGGDEWHYIPLLVEFTEFILRSRQASTVLWRWLKKEEDGILTRAEGKARRNQVVEKLLSITSSAVYIPFVWHHLVKYRQDLLDKYLGQKKSFRGVFFVEHDERPLIKKKLIEKAAEGTKTKGKKGVVAVPSRQGHAAIRARGAASGRGRGAALFQHGRIAVHAQSEIKQTVMKQLVELERKKEKQMLEEIATMEADKQDHVDFFCLEACYDLRRLTPDQTRRLGEQWLVQLFNYNRPVPEQCLAARRWTLMPSVDYTDIVKFLTEYNPLKEGDKVVQGLPVSVVETLIRGVLQNDDPVAPMRFLFSPKFMGSDYAKVAVYAVNHLVPYLPEGGLTKTIKMLLTGKARNTLKVTAYKELIRLLAKTPTGQHVQMILHEWNRAELHRDVRIAILGCAFEFLASTSQTCEDVAWSIIETAVKITNVEILVALLGAKAEGHSRILVTGGTLQKPRIIEHVNLLDKFQVPQRHCQRFVQTVIMELANNAQDDDIKFLAVADLINWVNIGITDEISKIVADYLCRYNEKQLLFSVNKDEVNIFKSRWEVLIVHLVNMVTVTNQPAAPTSRLFHVLNTLTTQVKLMKDRNLRIILVDFWKRVLDAVPARNAHYCLSEEDETKFCYLVKDNFLGLFWKRIFTRDLHNLKKKPDQVYITLHNIIQFISEHAPDASDFLLKMNLTSYLTEENSFNYHIREVISGLASSCLNAQPNETRSPAFKALSHEYALRLWTNKCPAWGLDKITDAHKLVNDFLHETVSNENPMANSNVTRIFKALLNTMNHGLIWKNNKVDNIGNATILVQLIVDKYLVTVHKPQSSPEDMKLLNLHRDLVFELYNHELAGYAFTLEQFMAVTHQYLLHHAKMVGSLETQAGNICRIWKQTLSTTQVSKYFAKYLLPLVQFKTFPGKKVEDLPIEYKFLLQHAVFSLIADYTTWAHGNIDEFITMLDTLLQNQVKTDTLAFSPRPDAIAKLIASVCAFTYNKKIPSYPIITGITTATTTLLKAVWKWYSHASDKKIANHNFEIIEALIISNPQFCGYTWKDKIALIMHEMVYRKSIDKPKEPVVGIHKLMSTLNVVKGSQPPHKLVQKLVAFELHKGDKTEDYKRTSLLTAYDCYHNLQNWLSYSPSYYTQVLVMIDLASKLAQGDEINVLSAEQYDNLLSTVVKEDQNYTTSEWTLRKDSRKMIAKVIQKLLDKSVHQENISFMEQERAYFIQDALFNFVTTNLKCVYQSVPFNVIQQVLYKMLTAHVDYERYSKGNIMTVVNNLYKLMHLPQGPYTLTKIARNLSHLGQQEESPLLASLFNFTIHEKPSEEEIPKYRRVILKIITNLLTVCPDVWVEDISGTVSTINFIISCAILNPSTHSLVNSAIFTPLTSVWVKIYKQGEKAKNEEEYKNEATKVFATYLKMMINGTFSAHQSAVQKSVLDLNGPKKSLYEYNMKKLAFDLLVYIANQTRLSLRHGETKWRPEFEALLMMLETDPNPLIANLSLEVSTEDNTRSKAKKSAPAP